MNIISFMQHYISMQFHFLLSHWHAITAIVAILLGICALRELGKIVKLVIVVILALAILSYINGNGTDIPSFIRGMFTWRTT